ncbi:MAG: helix-turn-helix transcriptional regulator [Desulfuromonadales bacterium]|nr:helix-turn-helix transcriptional regulator [Desulfuromonadales bacterium]
MYLIGPNARPVKTSEEIGALLRKKRKSQALTQAQVAEHCGVSPRFVSEVERGKASAEIGKVLYLLEMLGVDLIADTRD